MSDLIKDILMTRDGITENEANSLIEQAKDELNRCLDDDLTDLEETICDDYFGLEPEYIEELI